STSTSSTSCAGDVVGGSPGNIIRLLAPDERRQAASSVAPVSIRYGHSLRPPLACSSNARRAAMSPGEPPVIVAAWICLVAPLAATLAITLLGQSLSRRAAAYVASASVLGSFAAAVVVFAKLWAESPDSRSHASTVWEWLNAGTFHVALRMLVGLSSYLLIGFWHDRPSAVAAAKKAFIMNAIGDATMALAIFILIQHRQTLNFPDAFAVGPGHGWLVNLVALGLLGGAVAKSAQLPLQTWLPDAMEGPTPVSALIHAATMVTAGVYLIVRTHAVFEQAPRVQELAAGLGAGTLLMAGLIALVQTDIKRVIAYSTMSQIGYMFLGAGLGAYA